ncbi:hypothetical protein F5X98DRAFT_379599 [Xylaria grammica]|nr:hypothetical protein F5X98DRAFT_379599 [Xylaria grammica]
MNLYPIVAELILSSLAISDEQNFAMTNVNNDLSGQCGLNRTFIIDLDCWFSHPDPHVEQFHVSINGSSTFFCHTDIEVEDIFGWDKSLQASTAAIFPQTVTNTSWASH